MGRSSAGVKIEITVFGTRQQLAKIKLDEIELLDNRVKVSCKLNDLGIIFESHMSMNSQISHTSVVLNIISRLDTRNSLLTGIRNCRKLPNSVTCGCKIQRLQII